MSSNRPHSWYDGTILTLSDKPEHSRSISAFQLEVQPASTSMSSSTDSQTDGRLEEFEFPSEDCSSKSRRPLLSQDDNFRNDTMWEISAANDGNDPLHQNTKTKGTNHAPRTRKLGRNLSTSVRLQLPQLVHRDLQTVPEQDLYVSSINRRGSDTYDSRHETRAFPKPCTRRTSDASPVELQCKRRAATRSLRIKKWITKKQETEVGWLENEFNGNICHFSDCGNQSTKLNVGNLLRKPTALKHAQRDCRRLSTAGRSRRQQWLAPPTSSSISSENSECDDLPTDDEPKNTTELIDDSEDPEALKERRVNALKDKLNSKGQSFDLIDLLSAKKEQELLEMIRTRHTRVILDVCVLWSCLQIDAHLVSYFIKLGANPGATDAEGFSAMHLAAENSSADTIEVLFLAGANIFGPLVWDTKKEFTPLMLAVRSGNESTTKALIDAGADVNAGLNSKRKVALHYAVSAKSIECVNLLLSANAVPNPLTLYSETPLHIAVGEGLYEIVKILLKSGADVRPSRGTMRMASLHIAAQEGHSNIVQILLKSGADHKQKNSRGQTALHLAARSQSADTVQELLNNGADPNVRDDDGKTPLHTGIFKGSRCFECLKILVDANADPNVADGAGYTPLHLAALHESSYCVQMFLKHGGDVSARTKGGLSALNIILRKTPVGLSCLQEILDASISHDDRDQHHDAETMTQMDFRIFKGAKGREPECRLLTCFIKEGQRMLLKHPLCESFLHLKWQQVRPFFVINLVFYSLLVLALTGFILLTFPGTSFCELFITKTSNPFFFRGQRTRTKPYWQPYNITEENSTLNNGNLFLNVHGRFSDRREIITNTETHTETRRIGQRCATIINVKFLKENRSTAPDAENKECSRHTLTYEKIKQFLIYLIAILVFILVIKEIIQFLDTPCTYVASLDNLLVWPIIILTLIIIFVGSRRNMRSPWEHHVAAVLLLICWIELLLLVGRFPLFGLYVQMFAQVTRNFGKFFFTYICLISAFSLSFGVLFHNHDSFKYHLLRMLKTLVMMTGEMEYDEFFFESEDILYPGTSHIIFAVFLIFGTVILMNLLVGLAVSDIQGLQQSACLDRLVRQTQLIGSLELIIFSRWLSITTPTSLLRIIKNHLLLLPTMYGGTLTLASKNLNGYQLPAELLESVQKVAHSRDHGFRRRNAFANFRSMSQVAHYGGNAENEGARGLEAVHCGLELLVRESEDRKSEAKQMQESMLTIMYQLQQLLVRQEGITKGESTATDSSFPHISHEDE